MESPLDGVLEARDGTPLAFTAWLPQGAGPFPAVVVRTPYGRRRFEGEVWRRLVAAGYALVAADVRGRGDSGGTWQPWVNDGTDGYDVIEGVAALEWCTGDVATLGGSYDAVTQWWAAVHRPPHLRCMVAIAVSPLHDDGLLGRSNGVVMPYWLWWLSFLEAPAPGQVAIDWAEVLRAPATDMAKVAGVSEQVWDDYLAGRIGYGAQPWSVDPAQVDVPVLVTNGLWDDPKTFELWAALESSPRAADHRLLVGAWDHAGNSGPRPVLGGVDVSGVLVDPPAQWIAFLDRWTGRDTTDETPRVQVCRTGSWRWEQPSSWPVGRRELSAPLAGGGWRHDPGDPLWLGGGQDLAFADAPLDPKALESRDDVLTLDLPAVQDPLRISGFPTVTLEVEQPGEGTVVCWLTDVAADGTALQLGLWPTAAHHPGGTAWLAFTLAAVHHEVQPGHHLRVGVASSFAPIYAHALEPMAVSVTGGTLVLPAG